ncbi:MAG: Spy/CpxP family protein refolding chaperone [Sumerlaeia bacterium]
MKLKTLATTTVLAVAVGIIPFTAFSGPDKIGKENKSAQLSESRAGSRGEGFRSPHGAPPHEMKDLIAFWNYEGAAEKLGLDESQISQLNESLENAKLILDAERESLKTAMDALRAEMDQDTPNLDAVYAAMDEVADHKLTLAKAAAAHRVTVKTILTPEQEAQLKEQRREHLRQAIKQRVEERFGRNGGSEGFGGGLEDGLPPLGEGRPYPPLPPGLGAEGFDGPPPRGDFGPRRGGPRAERPSVNAE